MTTAAEWCKTFNSFEDADARELSAYLARDNANLAIDVDTLDAMIDGAKACRHAAELQSNIDRWEEQLTHMLSLHEYGGQGSSPEEFDQVMHQSCAELRAALNGNFDADALNPVDRKAFDERLGDAMARPSPIALVECMRRTFEGGGVGYDEAGRYVRGLPGGGVEVIHEAENSHPGNT